MIECRSVTKKSIQNHYDLATPFYRLLWGRHIHHGLWEDEASPADAQRCLIDRLAGAADLKPGEEVLDVGCGMGGSTIELALRYGCRGTGVTLSPVQRSWARLSARWLGAGRRVRFLCRDAERMIFPPASFDVVWNIECSEHFFDKPAFFARAGNWLRPGGRMALCAWLAVEGADREQVIRAVGDGFLCPSFGTAAEYRSWLRKAGLRERTYADLTPRVARTWEICQRRVRTIGAGFLARLGGRRMRGFVEHFATLGRAYRTGAMQYGLFIAEKPT